MKNTYDYIVVGAGSAGCVLANRLSADGTTTVCLIEAGPPDTSPLIHIPFGIIGLIREGRHNWGYNTEPEAHLGNRRLYWPRGKTLGGSSSINAMVYIRGNPADYDDWAASGCDGWGWQDVLPVFRDLEHNETWENSGLHGARGELNVAEGRHINPLSPVFVEAARECGLPFNPDFNGPEQEGVGYYQLTQKDGMRFSSAKAFLTPVLSRPNLTVLTQTQATGIGLVDGRAVSLDVVQNGTRRILYCRQEIILCGGAVNSPHLLMLSGIGPREELEKFHIPVRHELPGVGRNLQDHLDATVIIHDTTAQSIGLSLLALPRLIADIFRFFFSRRGFLVSNAAETGAFIRLPADPPGRPGVQLHFIPSYLRDHGRQFTLGHGCTIHACQLRPHSRGEVGLTSADPLAPPRIQPNYLSHPDDVQAMLQATHWARRLFRTRAFSRVNGGEDSPGEQVRSDEEIIADIRQRAETIYHPAGTCRMGVDAMAVVDPQLRVHGVRGLRVADASIMPTLIAGNTNAVCMMIGEKCARFILEERATA
ncbi:MAG: family oxidoreductase [Moraxellaceae bacterium]|jgi:choline dehydrogenase-like flavoprotein|nr:family oxidoreductase [Moraxellaceae bacterium]